MKSDGVIVRCDAVYGACVFSVAKSVGVNVRVGVNVYVGVNDRESRESRDAIGSVHWESVYCVIDCVLVTVGV